MIDAGTPRFAMKGRIKQYIEYSDWREWENATGKPFPKVIFVCPNEEVQKYLNRKIPQMLTEEYSKLQCVLTSQDKIKKENAGTDIWQLVCGEEET